MGLGSCKQSCELGAKRDCMVHQVRVNVLNASMFLVQKGSAYAMQGNHTDAETLVLSELDSKTYCSPTCCCAQTHRRAFW